MSTATQDSPPKVSFRIVTYWKRRRGEPGLTQMGSTRLDIGQALMWVLDELPEDSYEITYLDENGHPHDGATSDRVRLDIDWAKIPLEIREGTR